MRNYIRFEPVRTLEAVRVLGAAVIALLAYLFGWDEIVIGLVGGIWIGFTSLIGTLFVRNEVTPEAASAGD